MNDLHAFDSRHIKSGNRMMTTATASNKRVTIGNSAAISMRIVLLIGSLLSSAHALEVPKGFVAFRGVKCDADYRADRVEGAGVWRFRNGVESAKECFDLCSERKQCGTVTYIVGKQRCNMFKRCKPAEDEQNDDTIFWPYDDCPKSCRYFDRVGDKEKDQGKFITAARIGTPFSGNPFKKYWGTPYSTAKGFMCAGGDSIKQFSGELDTTKGTTLRKCMRECNKRGTCKAISFETGSCDGFSHSCRYCTLWSDCTHFTKLKNTRSWVKSNSNS